MKLDEIFRKHRYGPKLPVADPVFGRGPKIFLRFCRHSKVSQYWPGSRACLRVLEALAFFNCQIRILPLFLVLFFTKFLMYICVATLTNIYFSMKYSDYLDKCNFPFLHLKNQGSLFLHLV